MQMKKNINSANTNRFADFLIIFFFLLLAALSVNLFRLDMMRTVFLRNVEPVGRVIVKKNTVQRRISDRVLWDRLNYESPVYLGDLIRVADVSSATLNIENNNIELGENTLIRIWRSADGEGLQIMLSEGAISLSAAAESGDITLDLNGKQIKAAPGAVLSAESKEDGSIEVQVSEGTAQFIEESGEAREIASGGAIAMDADGTELPERSAVVTRPAPNARYLKTGAEPFAVNFSWNRLNLEPDDKLRLEIAEDRGFSQNLKTVVNLDRQTQVSLDTGLWHWRLSHDDDVIGEGRITIANGAGPQLQSPAVNSVFRYRVEPPVLNFQWAETEEAVSYILEVSDAPDFTNPQIRISCSASSFSDSTIGAGTWFWRVAPVFPSVYEGSGVFSAPSFFRIERVNAENTAASSAQSVNLAQWLAAETRAAAELPPGLPPEIVQQLAPDSQNSVLPAPRLIMPARGASFGIEDFRSRREIAFSWSAVQEADAYIFTLYRQIGSRRRQIMRTTINNRAVYTLNSLKILDNGTFFWQIEAVSTSGNAVQQVGALAESYFTVNFPPPSPVKIDDIGILYGN